MINTTGLRDRRPQRRLSSGGQGRTRSEARSEISPEHGALAARASILLLLILFTAPAPSFPIDRLGEILAAMQSAGDRLQTLTANFQQTNRDHILEEEETSSGKLFLQVPGRIRWEYGPPASKVLLVKDEKILLYNIVAHQVQEFERGQMRGAGADLLIGFGQSNAEIGKHYDVSLLEERSDEVVLRLIPKPDSSASIFAAIELTLGKAEWTPVQTVFYELNKDTTTLEFDDVKLNGPLPPRVFELDLPPGVEILRGE
ncbi:MAG TPA: outer membrane lipoprotein carrier protein LolA [Vicinamibacteria bacterium]